MSNIDEIIERINDNYSIDELIHKYIERNLQDKEEDMVIELLNVLRNLKKINDINLSVIINKLTENKKTIETINSIIDGSLMNYYKTEQLREIENRDVLVAKAFITDLFDLYILRFDPEFLKEYEKYGFESLEQMHDAVKCIDFLMNHYVSHCFVKSYVMNDLKDELDLSDDLTRYLSNLYEKYYDVLKQNYLLYKIRKIEDNMYDLIEKINDLS